jgi:hypothetical protein
MYEFVLQLIYGVIRRFCGTFNVVHYAQLCILC